MNHLNHSALATRTARYPNKNDVLKVPNLTEYLTYSTGPSLYFRKHRIDHTDILTMAILKLHYNAPCLFMVSTKTRTKAKSKLFLRGFICMQVAACSTDNFGTKYGYNKKGEDIRVIISQS